MPEYRLVAKIDQVVSKEILITVTAPSVEAAEDKARVALNEYPEKVTGEDAPDRMVTMKVHHWIPKSIDFIKHEELPAKDDKPRAG